MATRDFDEDLTALFAGDDAPLATDAEAFAASVDRRIGRQQMLRRGVLTGATLVGGLIAGTQVPFILRQMSSYGGVDLSTLDSVAQQMHGQPGWLLAIAFAAFVSTATLLSHDRI